MIVQLVATAYKVVVLIVPLVDGVCPSGQSRPGAPVRVRRDSIVQQDRALRLPCDVLAEPVVQVEPAVQVNAHRLGDLTSSTLQTQVLFTSPHRVG